MSTADLLRQDINRLSAARPDGLPTGQLAEALAAAGWVRHAPPPPWAEQQDGPCMTVRCGDCGAPLGDAEDSVAWHYGGPAEAVSDIEAARWTIQGSQAVCEACTASRACLAADGHDWQYRDLTSSAGRRVEWWECRVCGTSVRERPEGAPTWT